MNLLHTYFTVTKEATILIKKSSFPGRFPPLYTFKIISVLLSSNVVCLFTENASSKKAFFHNGPKQIHVIITLKIPST